MKELVQKYVTSEGVLIVGGLLWAIAANWVPTLAVIPVPGIEGVFPGFSIGPGHMLAIGLVPLGLKVFTPGKTPFVGAVNPPSPKEEGQ